jgi:hypothetical protein
MRAFDCATHHNAACQQALSFERSTLPTYGYRSYRVIASVITDEHRCSASITRYFLKPLKVSVIKKTKKLSVVTGSDK